MFDFSGMAGVEGAEEDASDLFHVIPWEDVLFPYVFRKLDMACLFRLRALSVHAKDCVDKYFSICPSINLTGYRYEASRGTGTKPHGVQVRILTGYRYVASRGTGTNPPWLQVYERD